MEVNKSTNKAREIQNFILPQSATICPTVSSIPFFKRQFSASGEANRGRLWCFETLFFAGRTKVEVIEESMFSFILEAPLFFKEELGGSSENLQMF